MSLKPLEHASSHARPRRNLEQKFRCGDLEAAYRAALAAGALDADVLLQRDVYFGAARGRLKLRSTLSGDGAAHAELIAYDRPDGPQERISSYLLIPVSDPDLLEAILTAALGMRATVRKRRRLLMDGATRLHFDEVEDLGTFVEFEAVLAEDEPEARGRERLMHWRELLGLDEPVPRSYVDLLTSGRPADAR